MLVKGVTDISACLWMKNDAKLYCYRTTHRYCKINAKAMEVAEEETKIRFGLINHPWDNTTIEETHSSAYTKHCSRHWRQFWYTFQFNPTFIVMFSSSIPIYVLRPVSMTIIYVQLSFTHWLWGIHCSLWANRKQGLIYAETGLVLKTRNQCYLNRYESDTELFWRNSCITSVASIGPLPIFTL